MTTPAGWYPEPGNPNLLRYWDGAQWTPQTSHAPGDTAGPGLPRTHEEARQRHEDLQRAAVERAQTAGEFVIKTCEHFGCGSDSAPGYEHCYHHLTADERDAIYTKAEGARHLVSPEVQARLDAARSSLADSRTRLEKVQQRQARLEARLRRPGDVQKVCPHCQVVGRITSRQVKQKKGVSGGKAAGAVLTGGVSILATGLSRKEKGTEMHCHKCNTKWVV